jgi:hypothetical protein
VKREEKGIMSDGSVQAYINKYFTFVSVLASASRPLTLVGTLELAIKVLQLLDLNVSFLPLPYTALQLPPRISPR